MPRAKDENATENSAQDFEQLGEFYLGKKYDLSSRQMLDETVLYDAKDLTTHAMCVGMTGSGKTGLCVSLLEEAAIDGIPAICIDPKGDIGNLLLAFPELAPADFEPWVESSDATRKGMDPKQYSEATAAKWRAGLADWGQGPERIRRYLDSVDLSIYTPGSNAGIPMTVLKNFAAPPPEVIEDNDIMRERVAGSASGLLALMGIEADPLSSREHILLSTILDKAWREGRDLDLPSLIRSIQAPPIDKIGVFDLESFFPSSDRLKFSMTLNNLLASPAFAGWLEGQALDVKQLLYTDSGKPRVSIISIAHLSDSERMFFVTILLNEVLSWMRSQPGTSSLRALLYMDEIYGYFPPTAKPPSKPPMLMLLKQARAFGLGVVLATQNPVDLDYKGLSNIGTWFLGRLQTQRDKERVLEGLEGAAAQVGSEFKRSEMEQTLAALGSRVFLMNNVHDDAPTIFHSRWAMSYLRGPLSRLQIQGLMKDKRAALTTQGSKTAGEPKTASATSDNKVKSPHADRPIVPSDVEERFWAPQREAAEGSKLIYRPGVLANVSCHFVRIAADIDDWVDKSLLYQPKRGKLAKDIWRQAVQLPPRSLELALQPEDQYGFADLPGDMLNDKQYRAWEKSVRDHCYRRLPTTIFECKALKRYSQLGESEMDARIAWSQAVRELRDEKKEKLRSKYATKMKSLESKIRTARQRLEREKAQYDQQKWSTLINFGQTVLGAIMGNRISSRSATTGRSLGRAAQQRTDVTHAGETLEELTNEKVELEFELQEEIRELQSEISIENLELEAIEVPCRKGDLQVNYLGIVWIPCEIDSNGFTSYLVDMPEATK
ncbi:MAG: ATP-binding protein [Aureliella sp.]